MERAGAVLGAARNVLNRLRISAIAQGFRALVSRLQSQRVYVAPMRKRAMPVITVYRQFDPIEDATDPIAGYYYSERAGRDSVAFLLFDADRPHAPYGALTQWHGPLRRFNTGAYTGSMDKPGMGMFGIAIEEVMEEAGFLVTVDHVMHIKSVPVSGQCNEICHLFLVDVTGLPPRQIRPENPFEANTERPWLTREQVLLGLDWKAALIALGHPQ